MKEYTEEGMDMHILRDELEAVHVFNLAKLGRVVEAGLHPENGLKYCMLP